MKLSPGLVKVIATAVLIVFNGGCVTSERDVARKLDPTYDIIQQASDLFVADPELSRFPVSIDGFKGDMRLRGKVATEAQRTRAERVVWAVKGVRSVDNKLQIGATLPAK